MKIERQSALNSGPHPANPNPTQIVPFGSQGAGVWTGHPIGLVIVVGLIFMGIVGLPEARLFFAFALPLGALCGFLLWLRHR
jgi:hypothetical protein